MKYSLILAVIIVFSNNLFLYKANVFQAIWAESYNFDQTNNYDYVTLKMKYYETKDDFENQLPPKVDNVVGDYFVLYKREKDAPTNVKKMFKDNLTTYDMFSFYFPNINDANHVKPYVMWGFELSCNRFLKFNIKVFNCNDQAEAFFDTTLSAIKNKFIKKAGNVAFVEGDQEMDFKNAANTVCLTSDVTTFITYLLNTKAPELTGGDNCTPCVLR